MIYGGILGSCLLCLKTLAKRRIRTTENHLIHRIDNQSVICSRIPKIIELCRNKSVLHIGFADSPFTESKIISEELLHLQLKKYASHIFGIDYDNNAVEIYTKLTKDENVSAESIYELQNSSVQLKNYETVLLAEVLEHLGNPLMALQTIWNVTNQAVRLIITVPNAFRLSGFNHALHNIEAVHNDHLAWYSPYTLTNLLKTAKFDLENMYFYTSHNFEANAFFAKRQLLADGIIGIFKKVAL